MSVEHRKIHVEREYPYPPQRVFQAWADAELKREWFDLAEDRNGEWFSDCRPGGAEYYRSPPGANPAYLYDAQHRDVVSGERIIVTSEITFDGRRSSVALSTAEFIATTSGTLVRVTEQAVFLDGLETGETRGRGITKQLNRLADALG